MIRIELSRRSVRSWSGCSRLRRTAASGNHCQAVLTAERGRRRGQIGEDLGVHRASLHRWLCAYQAWGLEGLTIRWAAGQPPRILEDRAARILAWVKEGPRGCELERANWIYAELATPPAPHARH
jgi:hypothetical protein